jgi:NADH-quinone oxidoreductase subunit J
LIFYAFAAIAVFSALMVILSRNSVHSVLFLVLTFFAAAGVWMLLHAEFLALILVLVYVGAVMNLFLFVVMMLSTHLESARKSFVRYLPFAAIFMSIIFALIVMVIGPAHFSLGQMPSPGLKPADYNNLVDLGSVLYTDYVYPFETAAVILLTAIIAAIALSHRKLVRSKSQDISAQIRVNPRDRVRLIKMQSASRVKILQDGECK